METKVKICGITKPSEALMLNRYQADYAGFVMFCEESKRNIACRMHGRCCAI